jgi:hypothetical protein
MALLDKLLNPSLFKPKWQHKDATVRKQALAHLTDEKILVQIAQQDTHKDIRLLALSKIRSTNLLAEFLVSEHTDLRKQAQHQHLVYLLPNQSQNDLHKINNDNDLVSIATFTDNEDLRLAAIDKLSDESLRLDIACNNPVAKVRLAAAQGITKSDSLQSLMHIAQGKDKALYRFCKDQLADAKAADDAILALQEKITRCISHAEQLANSSYSPEYNGRLQLLKQNWNALNNQSAQQSQQFEAATEQAEATLAEHLAEEKAASDKLAAIAAANASFITILQQLEAIEFDDDIASQLTVLQNEWQVAKQVSKPEVEQNKAFENRLQGWLALDTTRSQLVANADDINELIKLSQQLEKSSLSKTQQLQKDLNQLMKQLTWKPAAVEASIERPALLTDLDNALQTVIKHNQNVSAHEADSSKQLAQTLNKLEQHINDGLLKDANKSHQQAVQALKKLSQQESKKYQRQFQSLAAQLAEIRDWQGFAATPKKEALCESMETLIDSNIDASLLAEKIHELQEEWKTLGPIARSDDKILWNRFRKASDKAYEPCKAFYADMAVQRQRNLSNRQALVAQLVEYEASMDWQTADWNIVQKTLDAARETFRSFSPVDRSEHKASQASLQAIADKIYGHIKAEYQQNIEAKEALISQAKALQDIEELSQAIEQSKQLQADWKAIGMTPNKVDQKLWQDFRNACNAVFARRDEQREQNKANIEADIEQAEALVSRAESIVAEIANPSSSADVSNKTDATDTTEPAATMSELKDALQQCQNDFAQLSLPKTVYAKMRQRLANALQQQEDSIAQARLAKKQQAWTTLTNKLSAISLKTTDADKAHALYQSDATELKLPKGIDSNALNNKWLEVEANNKPLSSTDELRDACIALEITAGLESPADEQKARMAYQVQRLSQGLGQVGNVQQQISDSVSYWLTLNADASWQQRYNTALLAAAKQL